MRRWPWVRLVCDGRWSVGPRVRSCAPRSRTTSRSAVRGAGDGDRRRASGHPGRAVGRDPGRRDRRRIDRSRGAARPRGRGDEPDVLRINLAARRGDGVRPRAVPRSCCSRWQRPRALVGPVRRWAGSSPTSSCTCATATSRTGTARGRRPHPLTAVPVRPGSTRGPLRACSGSSLCRPRRPVGGSGVAGDLLPPQAQQELRVAGHPPRLRARAPRPGRTVSATSTTWLQRDHGQPGRHGAGPQPAQQHAGAQPVARPVLLGGDDDEPSVPCTASRSSDSAAGSSYRELTPSRGCGWAGASPGHHRRPWLGPSGLLRAVARVTALREEGPADQQPHPDPAGRLGRVSAVVPAPRRSS